MSEESTVENPLQHLLGFLADMTTHEQLQFWEKFREQHRARIAKTEAQLCPELLHEVDARIVELQHACARGA